ncbi:hypothetical protein GCM10020000_68720 [Streptomyces olivoverticillatus]
MRFRGKSIRRKIVALLLVPLVSLTALWAFATVITGKQAIELLSVADVLRKLGYPTEDMARALEKERRQALVYLADPGRAGALADLRARQRTTDKMVAVFPFPRRRRCPQRYEPGREGSFPCHREEPR